MVSLAHLDAHLHPYTRLKGGNLLFDTSYGSMLQQLDEDEEGGNNKSSHHIPFLMRSDDRAHHPCWITHEMGAAILDVPESDCWATRGVRRARVPSVVRFTFQPYGDEENGHPEDVVDALVGILSMSGSALVYIAHNDFHFEKGKDGYVLSIPFASLEKAIVAMNPSAKLRPSVRVVLTTFQTKTDRLRVRLVTRTRIGPAMVFEKAPIAVSPLSSPPLIQARQDFTHSPGSPFHIQRIPLVVVL